VAPSRLHSQRYSLSGTSPVRTAPQTRMVRQGSKILPPLSTPSCLKPSLRLEIPCRAPTALRSISNKTPDIFLRRTSISWFYIMERAFEVILSFILPLSRTSYMFPMSHLFKLQAFFYLNMLFSFKKNAISISAACHMHASTFQSSLGYFERDPPTNLVDGSTCLLSPPVYSYSRICQSMSRATLQHEPT